MVEKTLFFCENCKTAQEDRSRIGTCSKCGKEICMDCCSHGQWACIECVALSGNVELEKTVKEVTNVLINRGYTIDYSDWRYKEIITAIKGLLK